MHGIQTAFLMGIIAVLSASLVGCGTPEAIPSLQALPSRVTGGNAGTAAVNPSSTPDPLPELTLQPGDLHFRLDGDHLRRRLP